MKNPHFLHLVPTKPNQTLQAPYSFESLFFTLQVDIQYFVWRLILLKIQPCKVGCWVPPGTFLMKYGTFVRYISNKLHTFTYFFGSQKFSLLFGRIWSSQRDSYTPTVLDRVYAKLPEQIWASEAKNWPRYDQSKGTKFGVFFLIFCLTILNFTWKKMCTLTGHEVRG